MRPANSSAPRAPATPGRNAQSAPCTTARRDSSPRSSVAASAREGPLRLGSASERNVAEPARTRSANEEPSRAWSIAPSARQRPRASPAHSAARPSPSSAALDCHAPCAPMPPKPNGPRRARIPCRRRRENCPVSNSKPPSSRAYVAPSPARPRKAAPAPRSVASRLQGSAVAPSSRPRPQRGASRPSRTVPPAAGASSLPPANGSLPSRNVPPAPRLLKRTRWERCEAPPTRPPAP